jgi:hypothetical protein
MSDKPEEYVRFGHQLRPLPKTLGAARNQTGSPASDSSRTQSRPDQTADSTPSSRS